MIERPLWFGPADRRRFGWLSLPADGTATLGVVLCPPMGEEARSAHRTFRTLGAALAERGAVALKVDYDGTGDSVGAQDDPDRVAAWQQSIRDAITAAAGDGRRPHRDRRDASGCDAGGEPRPGRPLARAVGSLPVRPDVPARGLVAAPDGPVRGRRADGRFRRDTRASATTPPRSRRSRS